MSNVPTGAPPIRPATNSGVPSPGPETSTSQLLPEGNPAGGNRGGGEGSSGASGGSGGDSPSGGHRFQHVGLKGNVKDPNAANSETNETEANAPEGASLDQSSTSDAFVMSGTVVRAAAPDLSVATYGGPGLEEAIPGPPTGFGDQGGNGAGGFGGPSGRGRDRARVHVDVSQ